MFHCKKMETTNYKSKYLNIISSIKNPNQEAKNLLIELLNDKEILVNFLIKMNLIHFLF